MKNPFSKESSQYRDFKTMSDLKWHCTKCSLEAAQAKTWQTWRQKGIQLDQDSGNFFKKIECKQCKKKTIHRKLKSMQILEDTNIRSGISQKLAIKIKKVYNNEEALYLREMQPMELEIDHRFPQIRWQKNEDINSNEMTEGEIKKKFILFTRKHNLLKSRACEKCFQNNKRGHFPGIPFFYKGNENWQGQNEFDEGGCEGCFWYSPYKWRKELQKIIKS